MSNREKTFHTSPRENQYMDSIDTDFTPLSLDEILMIFMRWRNLSLIAFIGVLIPAVVVVFLILPLYEANGTVWVNRLTPQSQYAVQQSGMSGGTTFRNLERQEEIATYAEMIKARPIAEATVERLEITRQKLDHIHDARKYVRAAMNAVIEGVHYAYNETKYFLGLGTRMSPELEAELNYVRLIDNVIDRIVVTPVQDANIIRVGFKSSDPALARDVVNVMLDEFLKFSNTIREERAKSFFSGSTKELRQSLEKEEGQLLELQKKFSSYSVEQQREVLVTKYAEAKERLRNSGIAQARLKAQIKAYTERLKQEPAQILAQEQGVGKIKQGIVWETNPVHQELKLRLVNAEIELVASLNEGESTAQILQKYEQELRALGDANLLIKAQQRKISQLEEAYQINLRNLDGASAIQAMNLASLSAVRVVSYAPVPLKPIRPRKLYYLIFAFGGSLLIALGLPFLAYLNDDNISDANDIKKNLGLKFVTVFPEMSGRSALRG